MGPRVALREFRFDDVAMARELSRDPYVPLTGSLPANADEAQARAWIGRQRGRRAEGVGWSFAVAGPDDLAIGTAGLWCTGSPDVFTVGYGVVPTARRQGVATAAVGLLVEFAWTLPDARRLIAHVEPWNTSSVRVAERVGFRAEGRTRHEIGDGLREVLVLSLRSAEDPGVPGA